MESVDVLVRVNDWDELRGIEMGWKWKLQQYSIDVVSLVELPEFLEQTLSTGLFREDDRLAMKPRLFASLGLTLHVQMRCRVGSDQNRSQTGDDSGSRQTLCLLLDLIANIRRDPLAIENPCAHLASFNSFNHRSTQCPSTSGAMPARRR